MNNSNNSKMYKKGAQELPESWRCVICRKFMFIYQVTSLVYMYPHGVVHEQCRDYVENK
jgi:hypothetical protein